MKYFVRGWDNEISNAERILGEYNNYYKTIKNRISKSIEKALDQHDSHIIEGYFEENNRRVLSDSVVVFHSLYMI